MICPMYPGYVIFCFGPGTSRPRLDHTAFFPQGLEPGRATEVKTAGRSSTKYCFNGLYMDL